MDTDYNTQNNFIQSRGALDILKEYYDEFSAIRLFGFLFALMTTFFLTWFIPAILRKVFRDGWGFEINYESQSYKNLILNKYLIKNGILDISHPTYVENDYKNHNSGKIFCRSNVFSIIYLLLRICILLTGSFLSFLIISQDLISIITSFSVVGIITMVQFGVYLQHIFAHSYIITTSKFKRGDYVSFVMTGASGVIVDFGILDTTLLTVNPEWSELKKMMIQQQQLQPQKPLDIKQPDSTSIIRDQLYKLGKAPGGAKSVPLTGVPLTSADPAEALPNYYSFSTKGGSEYPFYGKFFSDHKKLNNHLGYDYPFLELRVPNYDMLFSHVYINKE
jgi:hypothetical protein